MIALYLVGQPNGPLTISTIPTTGETSALSRGNKGMPALLTNQDGSLACNVELIQTPVSDGYVQVIVNGIGTEISDGNKLSTCYFSDDGGETPKTVSGISAGDFLYWNGSIAGYNLDSDDEIDFVYAV